MKKIKTNHFEKIEDKIKQINCKFRFYLEKKNKKRNCNFAYAI